MEYEVNTDISENNNINNNQNLFPSNLHLFNEQTGILIEENISPVFTYLLNKSNPSSIKIQVIESISKAITENRVLVESFAVIDSYSIYIYLIDLYELEQDNKELKQKIIDLIKILIKNIKVCKDVYECLYKYCQVYYKKQTISKENIQNCLTLIELFYPKKFELIGPKNYFAFYNPNNEGIIVNDKQYEIVLGTNFILTFKILKPKNFSVPHLFNLVYLEFTNETINPISIDILNKEDKAYLSLNPELFEIPDTDPITFEYNVYYAITLMFHPSQKSLCLYINNSPTYIEYPFKQKYFEFQSKDNKISKFIFFRKFYGEVTTIINIKKCLLKTNLWNKRLNPKMDLFTEGLWNKHMFETFLGVVECDDRFLSDPHNFFNRAFLIGEEEISFLFVPFNKDKSKIVSDVFNRHYGFYGEGIHTHTYKQIYKNIEIIGGSWNLIPLLEMICLFYIRNNSNDNELLLKFFEIVNNIIEYNNERHIHEFLSSQFFEVVALFIMESNNSIKYDNNLIEKILSIGKQIFSSHLELLKLLATTHNKTTNNNDNTKTLPTVSEIYQIETLELNNEKLCQDINAKVKTFSTYSKTYYSCLVFNDEIIKHLSSSTLLYLLRNLDEIALSKYLEITTILFLLNHINPRNNFCCETHKNEFKDNFVEHSKAISNSECEILQEILNITTKVIERKIHVCEREKNFAKIENIFHKLLDLLSYNLSPCCQIAFIKLIQNELTCKSKSSSRNIKIVEIIINYYFTDIISLILCKGIIEVRNEIVNLILTICDIVFNVPKEKKNNTPSKLQNQVNSFLNAIKHRFLCDETFICEVPVINVNKQEIKDIAKHCVFQIKSKMKHYLTCSSFDGNTIIIKEEIYNQYLKNLYNQFSQLIFPNDENLNDDKNIKPSFMHLDHFNILSLLSLVINNLKDVSITIDFLTKINLYYNCKQNFKDFQSLLTNKDFLKLLFNISFHYFYTINQDDPNEQSEQIYNSSKQLYLNLVIETIKYLNKHPPQNKSDLFYPIDSIETLLTWSYLLILNNKIQNEIMYKFISLYLNDIFKEFVNIIKKDVNKLIEQKTTNFINDNYYRFINFYYYYFAHFKLDSDILINNFNSVELISNGESNLNPNNLINGIKLNLTTNQTDLSLKDIWQDYYIFNEFYCQFNTIWSNNEVVEKFLKENSSNKIDNVLKKYCLTKNETLYLNEILFIFNENNDMYKDRKSKISLLIILTNTFPMLLMIIDTFTKNDEEFNHWFNEYHNFLLFTLIFVNALNSSCEQLVSIHEKCLSSLIFTIFFLTKCKFQTKTFQDKINNLLVKLFKYILIILTNVNTESPTNSNVTNCLISLFYSYFTKMTPKLISDMQQNDYNSILEVLQGEIFDKFFFKNKKIIENFNLNTNTWNTYINIVKERRSACQEFGMSFIINNNNKINLSTKIHKREITKYLAERDIQFAENKTKLFKIVMKKYQELFVFKKFWSDKSFFFGGENKHYIKYKTANILTEDFSKPFLKPFMDIKNYLPEFLLHNVHNTFNYNCIVDDYYDFNLERKFRNAKKAQSKIISNNYSFNHSFILNHITFKLREHLLIEYKSILETTLNKQIVKPINFEIKPSENKNVIEFNCCLIKLAYHIKGIMRLEPQSKCLTFYVKLCSVPCILNPHSKGCSKKFQLCAGSLFEVPSKINPLKSIEISYENINLLLRHTYYYRGTSVKFLTQNNKEYLFNFHNETDRENFIKEIIKSGLFTQIHNDYIDKINYGKGNFDKEDGLILGYFNNRWNDNENNAYALSKNRKRLKLSEIIRKWKHHHLSNYKFLMLLNFLANRSFLDQTQYPVFPWIFNNYDTSNIIDIHSDNNYIKQDVYRDFSLPTGMLGNSELSIKRKNNYIKVFSILSKDSDNTWPYYYGTHYSNMVYLSHYLVRFYPFYSISLEIHDKTVDRLDRLFYSVETTYTNATTHVGDVRELIPEFYTSPEMFTNINNFDFNLSGFSTFCVNDVSTPCNSNPYEFVSKMKRGLESGDVTNNLFKWIDLIFGHKQKGKEGIKANNIFFESSYFEEVSFSEENKKSMIIQAEFGLIPSQLFPKKINSNKLRKINATNNSTNKNPVLYIPNKPSTQDNNVKYISTSIEEGFELLTFKILDHFPEIVQSKAGLFVEKKNLEEMKRKQKKVDIIAQALELSFDEKETHNDNVSLFAPNPNYDLIIYTISIYNNNYLYINSVCINKKNESQCLSDIIKKSPVTRSIPLCKMDTYLEPQCPIKTNYIYFSEENAELILSGFTDRKIISVSIYYNKNENCIEIDSQMFYSKYFSSPITASCTFNYSNVKYLLLGDQNGNLFLLKKQYQMKYNIVKIINDHMQEIKHITYDSNSKCFLTSSKDGFVNLYTVPSFSLLNSFEVIKNTSIDKVFLFHTPLYCFVAFNERNKNLICHSINIEQMLYEYEPDEEMDIIIKSPVLIEKKNANEYLAFINENNEIIVLTIPNLKECKKYKLNFKASILEYSKESCILIAIENNGCSIAYINIWE